MLKVKKLELSGDFDKLGDFEKRAVNRKVNEFFETMGDVFGRVEVGVSLGRMQKQILGVNFFRSRMYVVAGNSRFVSECDEYGAEEAVQCALKKIEKNIYNDSRWFVNLENSVIRVS